VPLIARSPSSSSHPIANPPSSTGRRPRLRRLASLALTGLLLAQAIPVLAVPAAAAAVTAQPGTGTPSAPQPVFNAAGPNLVQNPSFETPAIANLGDVAYTDPNTFVPGWTLSGSASIVRCESSCPTKGVPWPAADGVQSVDIAASSKTGTLTQAIATPIGHTFTLTFAYLPGPRNNDVKSDAKANVSWAGSKIALTLQDRPAGEVNAWKSATVTLPAAITSTTQLSFKGLAGKNFGFAIDSISVVDNAPVTPDSDEVAPPQLYRAAPPSADGGFDFAKMQVLGQTTFGAGTYELSFYAASSCAGMTSSLAPIATWTLTKSASDATPIFVTDALSTTIAASTPFVAAKVTGPASTVGVAGKVSGFSNCVVYGPENDTWPRALDISASGTADLGTWIDEPGIGRWFKVKVAPGGSVTVDLTSLPADYDVYLFKDIRKTYDKLTTETDLVKLSAEFAGSGFSGSGFSGSGFSGSGFSGSGFSAEDFSAAQYYSLIGWSNNVGTANEQVGANTWTSTGDFYIRVNGKNGVSSTASPFTIGLTANSDVCNSVSGEGSAPGPIANGYSTLILTDTSRFSGDTQALMGKLGGLATATNGTVVDFAGDTRVHSLQAQADTNPACVYAKNLVASAMKDVVDAYRAGSGATGRIKYVVLAGGDDVVPFFRYPDTASLAPEVNFYPPVKADSASEASLRANYVLGQDGYGSSQTITVGPVDFPVPGIPVGRLVENETEIIGMIDAYLGIAPVNGARAVSPATSLVTGYDFVADTANAVKANLDAGTAEAGGGDSLIQPYGKAPTDSDAWSAVQLKTELLGERNDITFLAGHFSASSALAADYESVLTTRDVDASTTNLVNTILFSIGCHSGYNTVDAHAIAGVTDPLDWSQVFARKGITSILGTGYQYGDTDFLEYSERIYNEFSRQLRYGAVGQPVAIGSALVASKIAYLGDTYDIADLHLKSLIEAGLYGLPMLGVDFKHGRLAPPPDGSGSVTLVDFSPAATGLKYVDLSEATPSAQNTKSLNKDTGGTLTATWYSGSDGVHTEPGTPALPLYTVGVTPNDANYVLRGVGFRGGTFQDTANITPLSGAPATELQTTHTTFDSPVFYPSSMAKPNYWGLLTGGNQTSLLLTPAQHKATQPGTDYVLLRRYTNVDVRLFYIDSSAPGVRALAPVVFGVTSDAGTDVVSARVIGDDTNGAGIHSAWVTYTTPGSGTWQSFDLTHDTTDTAIWKATRDLPTGTEYMVQAANSAGTVTVNDNLGAYYKWGVASSTLGATKLALSGVTTGQYGTSADVTATLTGPNDEPVDGGLVILTLGSVTRSGTTGPGGTTTITVPLSSAAGTYTAAATFLGGTAYQSSGASAPFTITKATSDVTVTCPTTAQPYTGTAQTPCTARVTGTTPLDDLDEPLVVSYTDNTASGTATASATYYGDAAHEASNGTGQFTIGAATATLTLTSSDLSVTYDGTPKAVRVTTTPAGLTETSVTYQGTGTTTYGPDTVAPKDAGTYSVVATLTNPNYTAAPATGTLTILQASGSMTLTASAVAPNPIPQFSDPLTLVAAVPAGAIGTVNFSIKTSPSATASTWTGSQQVNTTTNTASITVPEAPSLDQNVAPSGAATYYVSASFVADQGSSYSTITPANTNVAVGKEGQGAGGSANGSSRVEFEGKQFVAVGTAPKLTATLLQSLAPEATDRAFVDFSKVTVKATFQLYPAGCSPTCATAPAWPVSGSTAGTATVSNLTGATDGRGTVSVTAPKTLAEGAYLVVVTIDSNAYINPLRATSTLTVATTNGTYMNGGGQISPDSTSNAPNKAGAFGFNAKAGSSGPSGNAVYVYRMRIDTSRSTTTMVPCDDAAALGGACREVDVISRAIVGNFVPGQSTTYPKTAFIIGPALVQVVDTETGAPYGTLGFSDGNFRLDATDFGTNGTNDTLGFTLYRASGTEFHQAFIPAANPITQSGLTSATNQAVLSAGNLTVKPK
jgi:hypothetical protein